MPKKSTTPKPPKRPSWSVYKHKEKGWITFYIDGLLKPTYTWNHANGERIEVPPKYTREDFEEINPLDFTIKATLKFSHIYSGRSAVNFEFKDLEGGQTFTMLLREFEKVMTTVDFHQGAVSGIWKFEKHGSSVGICLVKEILDEEEEQQSI